MRTQTAIPQKRISKVQAAARSITIGIDIGDRWSHYCILDEEGEVVEEGRCCAFNKIEFSDITGFTIAQAWM